MGYSIYWNGQIDIQPPLTADDGDLLLSIIDWHTREERRKDVFADPTPAAIAELIEKLDAAGCPDFPLTIASPAQIDGDNQDSRRGCDELATGFRLLIDGFFVPRGYMLSGSLDWSGDQSDDTGILYIDGVQVEAVADDHTNPGPSWKRTPAEPAATPAPAYLYLCPKCKRGDQIVEVNNGEVHYPVLAFSVSGQQILPSDYGTPEVMTDTCERTDTEPVYHCNGCGHNFEEPIAAEVPNATA